MIAQTVRLYSPFLALLLLLLVDNNKALLRQQQRERRRLRKQDPEGIQSGPDPISESSFASGVVYNAEKGTVIVTGSTYGSYFDEDGDSRGDEDKSEFSGCFLASYQLPSSGGEALHLTEEAKIELHTPSVREACKSVTISDSISSGPSGKHILVAGNMEKGGLLEPLSSGNGDDDSVQYGMVLDITYDGDSESKGEQHFDLLGGFLMEDKAVVHPTAMALALSGRSVFVLSMESDDTERNEGLKMPKRFHHNPADELLYGQKYAMTIQRLDMLSEDDSAASQQQQARLTRSWMETYQTKRGQDIYPSQVAQVRTDLLLVVGSTAGSGRDNITMKDLFGVKNDFADGDMDGFLMKLHPDSGRLAPRSPHEAASRTFASVNGVDDWVHGMCLHEHRDGAGHDLYVVGSTDGRMVNHDNGDSDSQPEADGKKRAFVMKVNIETLDTVWTTEVSGLEDDFENAGDGVGEVEGISCALTPEGDEVYLAGTIRRDGRSDRDVLLVQLGTKTGNIQYAREVGSAFKEHDEFAGLTVDGAGNAVVVANTRGTLYRKRGGESVDVALFTVTRYQGHVATFGDELFHQQVEPNTSDDGNSGRDSVSPNDSGRGSSPDPHPDHDKKVQQPVETSSSVSADEGVNNSNKKRKILLGVLIPVFALIILVIALKAFQKKRNNVVSDGRVPPSEAFGGRAFT